MRYTHILLTLTIVYITLLISNVNAACTTEPVMTQEGNDVLVTGTRTVCTPGTIMPGSEGNGVGGQIGVGENEFGVQQPTNDGIGPTRQNAEAATEGGGSAGPTEVTVTEYIPGISNPGDCSGPPESRKCKVTIQPGFGSVMAILSGLIKYATFITALVGVLMLVVSGVQYSMAGAEKSAAEDAKKRIQKVILGLVLLFLVGFILNTVAPWVYR